jgi:hypothetical protein
MNPESSGLQPPEAAEQVRECRNGLDEAEYAAAILAVPTEETRPPLPQEGN